MSRTMLLTGTTTRPGRVDVDCEVCGRQGWWNWQNGTVSHGFAKRDVCNLKAPMVKVLPRVRAAA